jgi:hypothetical protein
MKIKIYFWYHFYIFYETKVLLLRDQPSTESELKPLTSYPGCDGQGYRTPRGAVIGDYGEMAEWLEGETEKLGVNLLMSKLGEIMFNKFSSYLKTLRVSIKNIN